MRTWRSVRSQCFDQSEKNEHLSPIDPSVECWMLLRFLIFMVGLIILPIDKIWNCHKFAPEVKWIISIDWKHDDVIKWKPFPRYWPFVRVKSPHKGQWHVASIFSLICAWNNDCTNTRNSGDLRRHRAHYDVIVMWKKNENLSPIDPLSGFKWRPDFFFRMGLIILHIDKIWNSHKFVSEGKWKIPIDRKRQGCHFNFVLGSVGSNFIFYMYNKYPNKN